MDTLGEFYELKPESGKENHICLGVSMEHIELQSGKSEWSMSSWTYVKNAIKVVEALLMIAETELT
jgi:hypothetical protein